ncbi:MAG TPA: YeeE/YedE thiosulfate transporter family protein [Candidatus Tumulicola sp.]|jgi:hypothetical protein
MGALITAPQWVGVLVGFAVGGLAECWGVANPESIIRLARWKDRLFIGCVTVVGAFGVLLLYGLYASGIGMHFGLKPLYFYGVGIGGVLFGIGLALSGYLPGTELMALGEGRREALFVIPAGLLGAASWTLLYQNAAGQWLVHQANLGSVLVDGRTIEGTPPFGLFLGAIPYALVLLLIALLIPRFPRSKHVCLVAHIKGSHDEGNPALHDVREDTVAYLLEGSIAKRGGRAERVAYAWSSEPNIYSKVLVLVALLLAITVVLAMVLHQVFGESTTYSWLVGVLALPDFAYSKVALASVGWEPFSDIGTFLGAFFAAVLISKRFTAFRSVIPPSWRNRFGNDQWRRALGLFAGGYLMLFGARMADGCASGHILSGIVQMAASGIYFGVVVIVTSVIAARVIYGNASEQTNLRPV